MKEKFDSKKRIKKLVEEIIEPSITYLKQFKKLKTTPHKDIDSILNIFFPKTKNEKKQSGFYKNAYFIHFGKRKYVLKEGKKRDIRKDYNTYMQIRGKKRNKFFAKIYWRSKGGKFILQKYGKKGKVPKKELLKLKEIGKNNNLKDIREANIMKFGNKFKIVDAERIK